MVRLTALGDPREEINRVHLRAQALARDGYRCRTCNAADTLEVHHRSYTYFGQENDDALQDLTTLCHACHQAITSLLRQRRYAARTLVLPNTMRILPGAPTQGKEPLHVHHLLRDTPRHLSPVDAQWPARRSAGAYHQSDKKISAQRYKTDADLEELARLEWYGGLYLQDGAPCIPGEVLEAHLLDTAKKRRRGQQVRAGLYCDGNFPLLYDGPREPDALWADPAFRSTVPARVQRNRVMRTRPMFREWGVRFTVTFNDSLLNQHEIIDFLHLGGEQVGLGDWRPKFGRYIVADDPT